MKPSAFSHAVLRSYRPEALMQWYIDLLDGEVTYDSPGFKAMTYDSEHHRIGFVTLVEDKQQDRTQPGLLHLAYTYPGIHALLRQYERMRDLGHKPVVAVDHGPTLSLYYRDPDGGNAECFVDRFSAEQAIEFMKSPLYLQNFVGYDIDLEDMLARMEAGATEEELMVFDEKKALSTDVQEIATRNGRLMEE